MGRHSSIKSNLWSELRYIRRLHRLQVLSQITFNLSIADVFACDKALETEICREIAHPFLLGTRMFHQCFLASKPPAYYYHLINMEAYYNIYTFNFAWFETSSWTALLYRYRYEDPDPNEHTTKAFSHQGIILHSIIITSRLCIQSLTGLQLPHPLFWEHSTWLKYTSLLCYII